MQIHCMKNTWSTYAGRHGGTVISTLASKQGGSGSNSGWEPSVWSFWMEACAQFLHISHVAVVDVYNHQHIGNMMWLCSEACDPFDYNIRNIRVLSCIWTSSGRQTACWEVAMSVVGHQISPFLCCTFIRQKPLNCESFLCRIAINSLRVNQPSSIHPKPSLFTVEDWLLQVWL